MALQSDTCSICSVFLGSCKGTKVTEIAKLLEALVQTNFKLFEELLICDACLIKVQSACKFKTSYLENSHKLCIKREDIENEAVCEICKESVNPNDCIPLFYSVTETDKRSLLKFLSSELELKSQDGLQTCELCHKSIINFCVVIKSFSLVIKDETFSDLKSIKSNSTPDIDMNTVDCTTNIKKEDAEVKEEQEPTTIYEDFLCKNEELDLKTENETIESQNCQEVNIKYLSGDYQTKKKRLKKLLKIKISAELKMFKCHICNYQTKHKSHFKRHIKVHKNTNEIEMFKCDLCNFQTKYKHSIKTHLLKHKYSDEIEMFKCDVCNFQTKYKFGLKKHIIIHKKTNEIETFKCHNCDYQTKYKSNIKKHMIVHKNSNEIKMFKCEMCDFQTKYKYNIKTHLLKHKKSGEIEMLKCHLCDVQTKYKSHLKKHMIFHKNINEIEMFKCQICDYQTRYKSYFKKHLIVHKN